MGTGFLEIWKDRGRGERGERGLNGYESPWPKPPHTLPKHSSELHERVLRESPRANPESYRFERVNEDCRHFLSLFNMRKTSFGLCTFKPLGSFEDSLDAQATPQTS